MMTNRPKSFNEAEAIETGLSDFCKTSLTVMKLFYIKQKPKVIHYKNYKDFSHEDFMHELEITLSSFFQILFWTFKSTADNILQKYAPIKKRFIQ